MNVIEIENLTYSYPGESTPALTNISLKIKKGDFLAVIGNNGCGKSTFCKVLNGLIPHFIAGEFDGRVIVNGLDTTESNVGNLAYNVGYVYQDFENQIVRPTVLDDASFACMNYLIPDYKEKGMEALEQCGLSGKEKDYIWQLSGGQKHLLALAGAVSLQPDILILDEPIAQLDPRHADQIYEVLKELNEEFGKTIIVIEHHTEYIADYCKNVLLLKDGQVQWKLPVNEALGRVDELVECNIFPPQVTVAAHHMKVNGNLEKSIMLPTTINLGVKTFGEFVWNASFLKKEGIKGNRQKEKAVSFQDVKLSYHAVKGEDHIVFDHLNLDIYKGEKIALIGSNGAGKSTLMKLMIGLLRAKEGEVRLNGNNIKNIKVQQLSKQISFVYQNPEEMFIKDSIEADIAYAMQVREIKDWEMRTEELMRRFRLTELRKRDGRLLSGGQMRRASLAIGIALNPGILLLDEPTANLDIATRKEIMHTLNVMKDVTETVMIATHDMQLVSEWAERIIVLCQGNVVADGTRDEIFDNHKIIDMVGIRPPEIFLMGQAIDKKALCYTVDEFLQGFVRKGGKKYA
ncbi:ABC transporter ATP-binding protein [Anaerosacchariphilus polymeriproducens]|uniref:ABC transporter ATP-binding protein n=1 Tax=Anaerosacchariphilus polymeriproducens TaxID=1812858 RepID=A0A371AZC2_9FIRM|nr:energy-coupling factor transporter ATPase [Anaerosacchariphilus polymeriproducens]RDU24944.1 ABC transporter ATP-binding protein [Anaerosacchariphilus polymeriproducens]